MRGRVQPAVRAASPRAGVRSAGWLGRLLLLLVLPGCTLIVGAGDYTFADECPLGREGCKCTTVGGCDEGLECRLPGFCVDPGSSSGHTGEGGSAGDGGQGGS